LLRQRLLSCIALESLVSCGANGVVTRIGDDLFVGDGKLSISIATCSPVSTLIHFALNVTRDGTPVTTACLSDLGVEPEAVAVDVMGRCAREEESLRVARAKIRSKGETQS
jgi:hypothetical protein